MIAFYPAAIVALVSLVVVWVLRARALMNKNNKIPNLPGLVPFAGNIALFTKPTSFIAMLEEAAARCAIKSGLAAVRVPTLTNLWGKRFVLVDDVKVAKLILARRPLTYDRPHVLLKALKGRLDGVKAPSVFSALGQNEWGRARRLVSPAFNHANVQSMLPDCLDLAASVVQKWLTTTDDVSIDSLETFNNLTFSVITRVGFGLSSVDTVRPDHQASLSDPREGAPQPPPTLLNDVKDPTEFAGKWIRNPWTKYHDMIFARDEIAAITLSRKRLNKYFHDLLEFQQQQSSTNDDHSLIHKLATSIDDTTNADNIKTSRKLTSEEVISNIMTFYFAGIDTTAIGLAWSVLFLAADPDLQRRVAHESREAGIAAWIEAELEQRARLSPAEQNKMSSDELSSLSSSACPLSDVSLTTLVSSYNNENPLRLAHGVFMEALRMHGPAPILGAELAAESAELAGETFKKGEVFFMMLRRMQMDSTYTPRADEFLPERWTGEVPELEPAPELKNVLSSLMFGGGPRVCPGRHLSELEASITLSAICALLELSPTSPELPPEETVFTQKPESANIRVTPRH